MRCHMLHACYSHKSALTIFTLVSITEDMKLASLCMPLIQVYMGLSSKISCFDCWPFSGGGSVVVDSLLLPLFVFFLCVMSFFVMQYLVPFKYYRSES